MNIKPCESYKTGVIVHHRFHKIHDVHWDKIQILDREANHFQRNISEMLLIKSEPNTLNAQSDT